MDKLDIKDCGLIEAISRNLGYKESDFICATMYPEFISFQFKTTTKECLVDIRYNDIPKLVGKEVYKISKIYHTIIKEKTEGNRIEPELP